MCERAGLLGIPDESQPIKPQASEAPVPEATAVELSGSGPPVPEAPATELWNTFVFASPAQALELLAREHLPLHAARFDDWAFGGGSVAEAFRGLPSADFSRDILQRATGLAVLAMPNVGWNDWGTPARVLASLRGRPAEGHLLARLARGSMSEVVA